MGRAMSYPVRSLAYGIPTLVPIGCSVGPSLGSNVLRFQLPGVFMWLNVPISATSICTPKVTISHPPSLPRRLSNTSRYICPRLLLNYCFCPEAWCMWGFCVCAKNEVSISSSPFGTPVVKSHWNSNQIFWGLVFQAVRTLGCGAWC